MEFCFDFDSEIVALFSRGDALKLAAVSQPFHVGCTGQRGDSLRALAW